MFFVEEGHRFNIGTWELDEMHLHCACIPPGTSRPMKDSSTTSTSMRRIRWDRLGLVALILGGCSSGMVALVGGSDAEQEAFTRLTHPKPVVALAMREAHPVLLRTPSPATETTDPERVEETSSSVSAPEERQLIAQPEPVAVAPEPRKERQKNIQPCSVCKRTMRVPKNPYTAHQSAARSLPNSFFVKNDIELSAGKRNGKLVEVEDGRGYRIARLTHSHAWLLPETYQLLQDMGNDFADALKGTASDGAVFRVTSVTRTDKQQRRLRRRNLNATNSKSTHSFGASFDIAFVDRFDDQANCGTPTREMERLLNRYQKAGIIYVIPEGGCMHITLRKP